MNTVAETVATAFRHLFPDRPLTAVEAATVEDILDAAAAWHDGALPFEVAADAGTGRGRWIARWVTPKDDTRLPALIALIEECVRRSGAPIDTAGRVYTADELAGVERKMTYRDGVPVVVFTGDAAVIKRRGDE